MKKSALFLALALASPIALPASPAWADGKGGDAAFQLQRKRQFAVAVPGNDPKVKGLMGKLIKAFNDQGRFKYVAVEIPGAENLESMRKELGKFLKAHAADYAGEGEVPDAKFGDVVLTPANVKAMLSSAYLFVPDLHVGPPTKDGKPGATYLDIIVYNVETGNPMKAAPGVQIPFSDKIFPETVKKNPDRAIRADVAGDTLMPSGIGQAMASTANSLSFAFTTFGKKPPTPEDLALREVLTAARRLDSFLLKSYVQSGPAGKKYLPIGRNIGVELDSTFEVQKKVKVGSGFEFKPAGWVKVRQTEADKSQFQTIAEFASFETGDRLVERPQSGLDFSMRLGAAPFDLTGGNALAPAAIFGGEYNLAPLTRLSLLSETYITGDFTAILNEMPSRQISNGGSSMMFGLKKRFTLGQLLLTPGFRGGVLASSQGLSRQGDATLLLRSGGLGVAPSLGIDWQITPDIKLGLDAGYILASPLLPSELVLRDSRGNEVSQDIGAAALLTGTTTRTNMSGPTASINATYSF